jgi:hypothetical protein
MKQKLLILFIFILCIQHKTFCQAPPCKYQTNDGTAVITDSTVGGVIDGYIQIIKTGSDYKIRLKFLTAIAQKTESYKIVKAQLLKIFLLNKDTVSLPANETKTGTIFYNPHLSMCTVVNEYNIPAVDIKRILASPCKGIEINFSLADDTARNIDLEHNMFHNLLINLLNCVMKG